MLSPYLSIHVDFYGYISGGGIFRTRLSVNSVEVDRTAACIRGSIKMTAGIQAGRK